MLNKKNLSFVAATTLFSLSALPSAALAETYVGANVAAVEMTDDAISEEISITALYGRVGMDITEYFSAELRLGTGINEDSLNVSGTSVDVELKSFAGAYIRGGIPNTTRFFPYAILGYTYGKLEASAFGESISDSESDVSFGVGSDFRVNETWSINLEYINYFDKDGGELEAIALGFTTSF